MKSTCALPYAIFLLLTSWLGAAPAFSQIVRGEPGETVGNQAEKSSHKWFLDDFRKIAFTTEYDRPAQRAIRRWAKPIRIKVTGVNNANVHALVVETAKVLAESTRFDVKMASAGELANFEVNFKPKAQFLAYLKELYGRDTMRIQRMVKARCFFQVQMSGAEIVLGKAVVPPDYPQPLVKHCLAEEMAQPLGLMNDNNTVFPSLFNDNTDNTRVMSLTWKDQLMLRLLYDPQLPPGTSEQTALPILQKLLNQHCPNGWCLKK